VAEGAPDDVTRRTFLAQERTWLAWWRSGVAAATAAVAVGGIAPRLLDDERGAFVALGAGYALVAVAVFVAGWWRNEAVHRALECETFAQLERGWVLGLTLAAGALAIATLVVIVLAAP
jgi:putative membrane protein